MGAVKALARLIPQCARYMAPLDDLVAMSGAGTPVKWSDESIDAFSRAQKCLDTRKTVTLPHPSDELWIVTDAASSTLGLGATLYVKWCTSLLAAGFFSANLRDNQARWLPCELEALAIAAAVRHWAPYIVQSDHQVHLLTDSKPCVQAREKLHKGQFSASPRVLTFLNLLCQYRTPLIHLAGDVIFPSDFASRHPVECREPACQICGFANSVVETVVTRASATAQPEPHRLYTNHATWLQLQDDCKDVRRARANLRSGIPLGKKLIHIRDVKRYIQFCSVATDGLLIRREQEPFTAVNELIVVPHHMVYGLLTALHLQLQHPSANQLELVFRQFFFMLDPDKYIAEVTKSCLQCAATAQLPPAVDAQSTAEPLTRVGAQVCIDIMKHNRQLLLVARESITSYTTVIPVPSEKATDLRDAILSHLPLDGAHGPAPGFCALKGDETLLSARLQLEAGQIKNPNKNPVTEHAIQEFQIELKKCQPTGGPAMPRYNELLLM